MPASVAIDRMTEKQLLRQLQGDIIRLSVGNRWKFTGRELTVIERRALAIVAELEMRGTQLQLVPTQAART